MKSNYDVVVVGAGPAGSMAARHAAEQGASVVLLERDREIGVPVRCAEATALNGLSKYTEIKESWITNTVSKIRLVAPNEKYVDITLPVDGIILNRRLFDHDLAAYAAMQGVEVYTKANVTKVIFKEGKLPVVQVTHIGVAKEITAKIVIAADGVESRIARCAGIHTQTKYYDIEPCAQMFLEGVDIVKEQIEFYFGTELAPGGYVWVFPKSDSSANVGLGYNASMSNGKTALQLLEEFVHRKYPNAKAMTTVAGGVPVANTLKEITADNLMIVGDAARQVNPMSGGGILSGMAAGKMAGRVAAKAIGRGDYSKKALDEYKKVWDKEVGSEHRKYYRIKDYTVKMTDKDFNDLAGMLSPIPPEKMSLLRLFKAAVKNKPSLVFDVIKLFSNIA